MRAAVNEIGRTAAVVGNEARSGMRRARVLDQVGGFAYEIGEWAAKERGKRKELRRKVGYTPEWKKAVVTLKEGHTIEFV